MALRLPLSILALAALQLVLPQPAAAGLEAPGRSSPAHAPPDVTVEAKVDRSALGLQEQVTYILTVKGAPLSEIERPSAPRAAALKLLNSRPRIQHSLVRTNGHIRWTVSFRWTYHPQRTGTLRLPPVHVVVRGTTHRTAAVKVRVAATARHKTPPASPGPSSNASPPDPNDDALSDEDIFIRATESEKDIHQNQQTTIEYRLFYRRGIQLRRSRLAGAWDAPGFWREELEVPSHPTPELTRENGRRYKTLLLKRVAVFPTQAGELRLAPLKIETEARLTKRSRGFLGRFLLGSTRHVEVTSDPIQFDVEPLPDGAPASFKGAVGRFRLDTDAGRPEVAVGEAVELSFEVSGYGNIAMLEAPAFEAPDAFEAYDPETEVSTDRTGRRIRGSKTFTYTLVPQERGTYRIPPVLFSYFDPDQNRYRTLRSRPRRIRVTGSPTDAEPSSATMPAGDIAGLMTGAPEWRRISADPLYRKIWPYAALLIPALLVAGVAAFRKLQPRSGPSDAERWAARPAAQEHLRQARAFLRAEKPRLFYDEIERALLGFTSHRLGVSPTSLTRPKLRRHLTRAQVAPQTQEAFFNLLDECDRARYAPLPPDREALKTASDRAHDLLNTFDRALGS